MNYGELSRLLREWCPIFQGYHVYYRSRRNPSPVFSASSKHSDPAVPREDQAARVFPRYHEKLSEVCWGEYAAETASKW